MNIAGDIYQNAHRYGKGLRLSGCFGFPGQKMLVGDFLVPRRPLKPPPPAGYGSALWNDPVHTNDRSRLTCRSASGPHTPIHSLQEINSTPLDAELADKAECIPPSGHWLVLVRWEPLDIAFCWTGLLISPALGPKSRI
jgi:hypothetical protein